MLQFSICRPPARLGMVASAADEECATALSHNTPVQQDWTAAECTSVDGVRLTSRLFQEASLMPLAELSLTRHVRDECPPKCGTEVKLYAIDRVQYDATYDSSSLENELNDSFLMNLDGVACPEHHVITMVGIDPRSSDCECPWLRSRLQRLHLRAANRELQRLKTLLNIGVSWRDLRGSAKWSTASSYCQRKKMVALACECRFRLRTRNRWATQH